MKAFTMVYRVTYLPTGEEFTREAEIDFRSQALNNIGHWNKLALLTAGPQKWSYELIETREN